MTTPIHGSTTPILPQDVCPTGIDTPPPFARSIPTLNLAALVSPKDMAILEGHLSGPEALPGAADNPPSPEDYCRVSSKLDELLGPSGNVDPTEILGILHDLLRLLGKVAREQRNAETEARITEMQESVAKLKEAARDDFIAAVVGASVSIAMSCVELGMSLHSLKGEVQSLEAQKAYNSQMSELEPQLETTSQQRAEFNKSTIPGYDATVAQETQTKADIQAARTQAQTLEGQLDAVKATKANTAANTPEMAALEQREVALKDDIRANDAKIKRLETQLTDIQKNQAELVDRHPAYKTLVDREAELKMEIETANRDFKTSQTDLKLTEAQGKIREAWVNIGRKLTESAAKVTEAKIHENAEGERADSRDAEIRAQLHGEQASKADDWAKDLKEMMREVRELIASIASINNQAVRNIINHI